MAGSNSAEVMSRAGNALSIAKRGLQDLCGDDLSRRREGLYKLAIHGRSVTFILQNLRSTERDAFDNWYQRYKDEMSRDELMRFFVDLRNELEKKGDSATQTTICINKLNFPSDIHGLGPRPPNAKAFVIDNDGPAWVTEDAEVREEVHPVQAPRRMVNTDLSVRNPPKTHLGMNVEGKDLAELCRLYLTYLDQMLVDARRHFL